MGNLKKFSMLVKCWIVALVLLNLIATSSAQPEIEWSKSYGGSGDDYGYAVQQTSDGGYIVAGATLSFDNGLSDVYILKLDSNGNLEWEKTYGGSDFDYAYSVQQTSDGGYIVAGWTESFGNGKDVYILKLDSNGNLEWRKVYGSSSEGDLANSVQQTSDGGYIVAGYSYSFDNGLSDVYILKLDSNGNLEWEKTYDASDEDVAWAVQQTSDGGYIVAGYSGFDVYILKLDSNGNLEWEKTYGTRKYYDGANSVQQTSDGGYIVAGWMESLENDKDVYILKLDSNGNLEWEKTYGGTSLDIAFSIQQTSDGGYIVAGWMESLENDKDVYILKLDLEGGCDPTIPYHLPYNPYVHPSPSQPPTASPNPEIEEIKFLEEEFYNKALETMDVHADNLARITADCIYDIFVSTAIDIGTSTLDVDLDDIGDTKIKFLIALSEAIGLDPVSFNNKVESVLLGQSGEESIKNVLKNYFKEKIENRTTNYWKKGLKMYHEDFVRYLDEHSDELTQQQIDKIKDELKKNIQALEEAKKIKTDSLNPFVRLPFVYLGSRDYQINSVSMAVCAYDLADSSYLAKIASVVYKLSGKDVGGKLTTYGLKPGVVIVATNRIDGDAMHILNGYRYVLDAVRGKHDFCSEDLIDTSSITPIALIASKLSCPAHLHAYDSQGRHIGFDADGKIEVQIPDSYFYYNETANSTEIVIFNYINDVRFEVKAFDEGSFDLEITKGTPVEVETVSYTNIPLETKNAVSYLTISVESTDNKLKLDNNGDGKIDREITAPVAMFTYTPRTPKASEKIVFDGSSSKGEIVKYEWSFGDGTSSSGDKVEHSYSQAGVYTVNLVVTNKDGLSSKKSVLIEVVKPSNSETQGPLV